MKNKKFAVIAFVVLIMATLTIFAGCGCSRSEEPTVPPTQALIPAPTDEHAETPTEAPTDPAPTEPEWQPGLSKASYVEALYSLLNKGDEVEVVGKFAHYFVIAAEPYDLLVDESYIRLDNEAAFKSHTAYSRRNRPVFASVYMRNEPIANLALNTKLTVLEAKNDWVFVEWTDGKGYMMAQDISNSRINTNSTPIDGTDVDVKYLSAASQQGNVMLLGAYHGPEMEAGFEKCKGTVLADEVEAYLTVFGYGAEMKVVEYDDEFCTVYLDTGVTVKVNRQLVKIESDTEEEFFSGYARSGAVVYKEYQRRTEHKKLSLNDTVEVLYKLPARTYDGGEVYAVSVDGEIMYMEVSTVSETKLKPASSSGSSDVWTPPAL